MNRFTAAFFFTLGVSSLSLHAVTTVVSFDSGSVLVGNNAGSPLSAGAAADGNGTVIQLGYFTGASAANNFAGTWVPLTGAGSNNTQYNSTSIGDYAVTADGNGTYGMTVTFDPAVAGRNMDLPAGTTIPLAIRFYDATTVDGSSFYNTVSHDSWLWKVPGPSSPTPPTINMSLDQPGLEWEGGGGSALRTTIAAAVPEPSRMLLALVGVFGLALRRRRR